MKKQCHDQIEELVSRYGKIDIVWYDGAWLAIQAATRTAPGCGTRSRSTAPSAATIR
jgi:hypothetical protein